MNDFPDRMREFNRDIAALIVTIARIDRRLIQSHDASYGLRMRKARCILISLRDDLIRDQGELADGQYYGHA